MLAGMKQDNQDFGARVSKAVFEALIEAGRRPGSPDTFIDVGDAVDGMAQAMSSFLATTAGMIDDREKAADAILDLGERVVAQLTYLAGRVREGTFPEPDREPPNLRVVE